MILWTRAAARLLGKQKMMEMFKEICLGLQRIHVEGLAHRGLHSKAIMLHGDMWIKAVCELSGPLRRAGFLGIQGSPEYPLFSLEFHQTASGTP